MNALFTHAVSICCVEYTSPSGPTNIVSNKSRLFPQAAFFFTVFPVSTAVCFRVFPFVSARDVGVQSQAIRRSDAERIDFVADALHPARQET